VTLIAAKAADHFREDTPTAVLMRQILGWPSSRRPT
jgi:hypothetical protein